MTNRIPASLALAIFWVGTSCAGIAEEPPSLAELLKEHRSLGLPLPPQGAKLVQYEVGGTVEPKTHWLAFLIKAGTKDERPTLLFGTDEWQPTTDPRARVIE